MKKLMLIMFGLTGSLQAGAIIRSISNNSTNADIIVMDVEQPKKLIGAQRYVSSEGYGWAIKPKKYHEDKPTRVLTNWGAGAYKYIMVREHVDGVSCRKYCLLIDRHAIKLKKRENCSIIANEKCGTANDDFPDVVQSVAVKGSSYIDLFLSEDGRTLSFTAEPQPKIALHTKPPVKQQFIEHEFEMPYGRKVSQPEL